MWSGSSLLAHRWVAAGGVAQLAVGGVGRVVRLHVVVSIAQCAGC